MTRGLTQLWPIAQHHIENHVKLHEPKTNKKERKEKLLYNIKSAHLCRRMIILSQTFSGKKATQVTAKVVLVFCGCTTLTADKLSHFG